MSPITIILWFLIKGRLKVIKGNNIRIAIQIFTHLTRGSSPQCWAFSARPAMCSLTQSVSVTSWGDRWRLGWSSPSTCRPSPPHTPSSSSPRTSPLPGWLSPGPPPCRTHAGCWCPGAPPSLAPRHPPPAPPWRSWGPRCAPTPPRGAPEGLTRWWWGCRGRQVHHGGWTEGWRSRQFHIQDNLYMAAGIVLCIWKSALFLVVPLWVSKLQSRW